MGKVPNADYVTDLPPISRAQSEASTQISGPSRRSLAATPNGGIRIAAGRVSGPGEAGLVEHLLTRRPGHQVDELLRQRGLRRMFEDGDRIRDGAAADSANVTVLTSLPALRASVT